MRCHARSWATTLFLFSLLLLSPSDLIGQDLQLPADYGIDIQLAAVGRARAMHGSTEITGTKANEVGDEVFHRLIDSGFRQPYPWKLTLLNNGILNATSTPAGQIYVDGGMLPVIGQNKGLWAAVLSHETAHTGRRHGVILYLRELYNQRMIQYYRARIQAGDKSANWGLIGFATASRITLKKLQRDQEHDADQQGMLLMARAGYHPDNVFALHHLLVMRTGEQSKFAAFFSDHPRWETRDQRSDKVYADALAEFNSRWPDASLSPGGRPPVVAFLGQPEARPDNVSGATEIKVPMYCRNSDQPVNLVLAFTKDNRPVKAAKSEFANKDGNLVIYDRADCLEKNETTPVIVRVPAEAIQDRDRALKAVAYIGSEGEPIAVSKPFDVHFPKPKRQPSVSIAGEVAKPSLQSSPASATVRGAAAKTESKSPVGTASLPIANLGPSNLSASSDALGTLLITSTNEGAQIFVDSTGQGKVPVKVMLKPGNHSVQVVVDGYEDWVQEVTINAGEATTIAANLRPAGSR